MEVRKAYPAAPRNHSLLATEVWCSCYEQTRANSARIRLGDVLGPRHLISPRYAFMASAAPPKAHRALSKSADITIRVTSQSSLTHYCGTPLRNNFCRNSSLPCLLF